jgi:hypothetical protein
VDECKPLPLGQHVRISYTDAAGAVVSRPYTPITSDDDLGWAVQVRPIKPMLKLPGTTRLKLGYEEPPSDSAFKFNLRRYTRASWSSASKCTNRASCHGSWIPSSPGTP